MSFEDDVNSFLELEASEGRIRLESNGRIIINVDPQLPPVVIDPDDDGIGGKLRRDRYVKRQPILKRNPPIKARLITIPSKVEFVSKINAGLIKTNKTKGEKLSGGLIHKNVYNGIMVENHAKMGNIIRMTGGLIKSHKENLLIRADKDNSKLIETIRKYVEYI